MIKNIAHIKFRGSNIGKFEHLHIENIKVKDACVIETDEGIEIGHVLNFEDIDVDSLENENNENIEHHETHNDEASHDENISADEELSEELKDIVAAEENHNVKPKNNKNKIFNILRIADEKDLEQHRINTEDAAEAFKICKEKVNNHNLDLKLISSYYFLDRAKLLFEFIAEERIDFRELVKDLAAHFKTRIELRQIGVRDEARSIGGCGICGRELCCKVIRGKFETITIKMAKEQGMLLNTMKISGQCGRLMCCLGHEYQAYCSLKKDLPKVGTKLVFNSVPAVIKDLNPLNKKLLIETEDKRLLYISVSDLKTNEEGFLIANIKAE
ncbi:regulatory iron-sulfur-containing complex subunit RicT [Brachyspira innocens]|uniref:Regulatory iron-sulfur-containing complex subunit RicT n=1 Tax=Brachyspira innocens TaxID=13264 RepID=A0ABT8YZT6_9SPIR|nr:regulatory iron-sulfur-containing complex subunit RicT [Brachyspira innocens]MDO6994578.1 regulatory iron-sulfur-containing complex subunit RicT [Brachyspira innocens]MDO7020718.1 regulatory iron-sulfur-containing complex subunit RicT [Brachyspira innocens]